MKRCCVRLLVGAMIASGWAVANAEITVERNEQGAAVKIDGQLFTQYLIQAGHEPALYPLIGPTGKPVTRSYPFTPAEKDGTKDHPHHQSFWVTHGAVNGIDFWGANKNDDKGDAGPHIVQRQFVTDSNKGETGQIATRDDWMNGDKRVCEDERSYIFGTDKDGSRWIDVTIKIAAPDGDVIFGDTKEGSFALRMADTMRVEAKAGGHIVNSERQANDAAWGQPARWVDYTGPVDGETVGVALMSHPTSFHPTPRWHVRGYGLFAANPFGQKDFPHPDAAKQGAYTIKKDDSITLKYRVWLHKGATNVERTEEEFREFVGGKS